MITNLYLSPHSDDIAFCCGGSIAKDAERGLAILTIFSKSKYTQAHALDNDPAVVTEIRTREDMLYCESIRASYNTPGFSEANLRGYPNLQSLYQKRSAHEDPDFEQIRQAVVEFVNEHPKAKIFSPIGIGNHIEHLITTAIAVDLEQRGREVSYYEDLPYALEYSMTEIKGIVCKNIGHRSPILIDISDAIDRKREAIQMYKSQVDDVLLEGIVKQSLRYSHSKHRHYERFWR